VKVPKFPGAKVPGSENPGAKVPRSESSSIREEQWFSDSSVTDSQASIKIRDFEV